MLSRSSAAAGFVALAACHSPTRPAVVTEVFSGSVTDAPMSAASEHGVRVGSPGRLTATLSWTDVPSPQPVGRAELRLVVRDSLGRTLADSLGTPGGSPLVVSASVAPGPHTLSVEPRFRDRIAFYCLCDVPYRLRVEHP